jgi:methyl-accepting chemotaxis protein
LGELVLTVLMAANLVLVYYFLVLALRGIARVGERLDKQLEQIAKETTATLTETREALERIETLSTELERVVRDEASPAFRAARIALENVEGATRGVNDGVQSARRMVGAAEALSSPAALAGVALKVVSSSRGKAALAGIAAALVGLNTVLQGRAKKP